ncbi:MAG: hypothetical protein KH046_17180 [Stenotrophomonas maltophilia]|nr:hypothetical protein [Stenotrophomonas sp. GD04024]MBS4802553.1 hypothetical protein [Stenotrophomonas maltophilia]MDG9989145.1 hypothetical protein [Stenotrophomonas sp. GD04024]
MNLKPSIEAIVREKTLRISATPETRVMHVTNMAFLTLLFCGSAVARGDTDNENEEIWRIRQMAAQLADLQSSETCKWRPESETTFADDIEAGEQILAPDLFATISTMIRQDQNALAIFNSFYDSAQADKAATRLRKVNARNLSIMKQYFATNEFPGTSEIGENGINALLLLIAHADADIEFQERMLEMINAKVSKGKLPEYIPSILKSIRPQLSKSSAAPDRSALVPLDREISETPRQCYYSTRSKLILEHLRDIYQFHD